MILCEGNYDLGAYGMEAVHNREPERKLGNHLVYNIINLYFGLAVHTQ